MNVNKFYKELFEDVLGLNVLGLEYFYPVLIELVSRRSLSTFSDLIFHRYEYYFDVEGSHLIEEDGYQEGREYFIRDSFLDRFNLQVLGLEKVKPMILDADSDDLYFMGLASAPLSTMDLLLGSEANYQKNLTFGAMGKVTNFSLTGPRSFRCYNQGFVNRMRATLLIRYPNIASIPEDYKENFLKLAMLDVKNKLWNELKFMEDLATPGGSVNLKISDYESALNERDDYVKELRELTFPDRVGGSYFTVL